jgi:hypothetical protein
MLCNNIKLAYKFGFSISSGPVESYNASIKRDFTCLVKYNLIPALECFEKCILYESRQVFNFQTAYDAPKTMINNAYSISKNFVIISSFKCQYRSRDGSFFPLI